MSLGMVNIIDLKREINHILGDKSTEYFKLLTLYFSGRIEKGIGFKFYVIPDQFFSSGLNPVSFKTKIKIKSQPMFNLCFPQIN